MKWEKIANEYVVSLFPVFMLPIAMVTGSRKFLNYQVRIAFKIENNAIDWYNLPSNWKEGHKRLVERVKNDPTFLRFAFNQMVKLGRRQIAYAQKFNNKVSQASNKQLLKYYHQFNAYNIEMYQIGLLLPLLDYQDTTFLSDELHRILKQKKADQYFNILTIPLLQTTVKKQEIDLLKILKANKQIDSPKALKQIKKHTKNYTWAYYVYEGPAANEQYFLELLKDLRRRRTNPEKELKIHEQSIIKNSSNQKKTIAKLKLNSYEKQIVELARDSVFYKAYRRELQSCSYYYMEPLLVEIAKRLGLSLKQLRMLLPQEISQAFKGKNFLNLIQERQKLLFYEYNGKMVCLSGEKARKYIQNNVKLEKINLNIKLFQGTTAYPGKVKGKAQIINSPQEMNKMKKGDILVAITTSPNLMPAIRLAKAIVTEEGGLTCHAAIVARELRIPCVVGAKSAAHALKDRDKIEVDAGRGIVKKI